MNPPAAAPPVAVSLVADNATAFALRALSAGAASRSLDLQYYFWHEDVTGRLLAREVLRAADRGVQVRLLLDDLCVRHAERELATLSHHPAIDVRLYNPFYLRGWGWLGRAVEFLFASYRLNHRMHNKAWIVDGELAICGGRNIGDEYFDASREFNFRDLDLVLAGAAAEQARSAFDLYWQSPCVRPIEAVALWQPLEGSLDELRRRMDQAFEAAASAGAWLSRLRLPGGLAALLANGRTLVAADQVEVVADPPGKGFRRRHRPGLLPEIRAALTAARREVLLLSPYFVPGRRGARLLIALARRGVRVSVVTNSLAATDVLAVHGGYARYRRRLLRAGIELYELRRDGHEGRALLGSGGASLHTKAFCVDRALICVGSFNLDPRSANLNTEMGVFVRHPASAAQLVDEHARLADGARSWKVELQGLRLVWRDRAEGRSGSIHAEPDASLFRRVVARALGWLPLEPQL